MFSQEKQTSKCLMELAYENCMDSEISRYKRWHQTIQLQIMTSTMLHPKKLKE